jgi:CRISPR/Cas system CSM-associated protein Csm2 small subunit
LPKHLKLDGFYTPSGAIRPEVYVNIAKEIASFFNNADLKTASVRRFFEPVRAAYERYLRDRSFECAMERLYRLRPLAQKSEERQITKPCFTDFMEYYIELTSKDQRNLKGFKELFMSVMCYLKS